MKTYHISWLSGAVVALALLPAWAQDDGESDAVVDATANESESTDVDSDADVAVEATDLDTPAPSLLDVLPTDRVFGDRDAPVTIFEFSSMTCPHCATFHVETLPELKRELIDTGQANLVIRHFPLDQLAMNAAMIAECVPEAQYYPFIDILYTSQQSWVSADNPLQAVLQTAMLAGAPRNDLEDCLQDEAVSTAVLSTRLRAQSELGVESTPTFFVGGEMIRGTQGYGVFAEAVAAAVASE